ncbi:MAG: 50S ribosomal protein L29 [Anaerolineae bacterium]|nr:50S ribosomal protein L29 [Anaerolineae bacterium]MEB2287463.1 50S ribosomal protein L29 [Anaerolineae bacterium]
MRQSAEIRKMTDAEIARALDDAREEMFNLHLQRASGQLEDHTRIRQLKKGIARLLTIQHQRQLAAELVQQEDTDA